jgi:hypothetical protein
MKILIEDISSVYSGRPGCCCGCRGKHTYASAHRKWASENRGYPVTADEVSDRTVKMIVGKIEKAPSDDVIIDGSSNVSVEVGNRVYIAYFKN